MTKNQNYEKCKTYKPENNLAKCKPKHSKSQEIILECGEGTGSRAFTSSNDAPFQLAFVTLDTTCLKRPEILIKFSSIVRVERLDDDESLTVRLQYELSRACEDGDTISLGTWLFERVDATISEFTNAIEESFNFIFCECTNCPRCCDYFVTVTPLEITNARAIVSNGRMAALSESSCDYSKNEDKTHDTKKYDDARFKQKHSKAKEIILECGQETGSIPFNGLNETPVRVANVTIDTSYLYKPEVLIEFSSIVSYDVLTPPGDPVILQFELFRACDNGDPVLRGTWRFEVDFVNQTVVSSKAFGFIFCECDAFLGCCEYFVTLTPIDVPIGLGEGAMISDSRIVALAQSDIAYDERHHTIDYGLKGLEFKEVLLECGQGTGMATFTPSSDFDFQLSQVTIDTTGLCKPQVNIEFSSLVSYEEDEDFIVARLRYELFRICDDGQPESRGVWVWRRETGLIGEVTESFDFTFCESIVCRSNCCTYFVKVTPIVIGGGEVTVSNGRMAAVVRDG